MGLLGFSVFHCLPNSAWAVGNLAEVAGQLGNMVEHPNQSQPNPGSRPVGTPCIYILMHGFEGLNMI